jgi:hypothetical protein
VRKFIAGSLLLSFFNASNALAVDVWGTVVWGSRTPAAGVELRLMQGSRTLPDPILTNPAGRYGLYGLATPTSSYSVLVVRAGKVVTTTRLPVLQNGARVPDIVLP